MKIIFFGNSYISADFLKHLLAIGETSKKCELTAVVTTPPKPAGRGLKLQESPVKTLAVSSSIPFIFETEKPTTDKNLHTRLSDLLPDLGVVISYGKIIPRSIFSIPRYGCINLHFSLLPHLRGAAPIQWALARGEKVTGVSIFFINEKLDEGDIIVQKEVGISDDDDFFTLRDKLVSSGKVALEEALALFEEKSPVPSSPQSEVVRRGENYSVSYAPVIKKSDGKIDWNKSATEIRNMVRAFLEWPVAYTFLPGGKMVKIFKAKVEKFCPGAEGICPSCRRPGEVTGISKGEGFLVACGKDFLKVLEVQPANSRRMGGWDFVIGGGVKPGIRFLQEG